MDIICAKCGKHFSSIESAREHSGKCKETSKGEPIRWIPAPKSKITPEEWESLMKCINSQDVSPTTTPSNKEAVKSKREKTSNYKIQNWLIALLFIFAFCIIGLGVSVFVGLFIPFWILFGFSLIYSIERWFNYPLRKHKSIGKLYRLFLNLCILYLLGLIIWSGIKLFSIQFTHNSLVGCLILLAEIVCFIWLWRVVAKNSWRWPSMKLTVFSLIVIFMVFAFAGIQPMSSIKDETASYIKQGWQTIMGPSQPSTTAPVKPTPVPTSDATEESELGVPELGSPWRFFSDVEELSEWFIVTVIENKRELEKAFNQSPALYCELIQLLARQNGFLVSVETIDDYTLAMALTSSDAYILRMDSETSVFKIVGPGFSFLDTEPWVSAYSAIEKVTEDVEGVPASSPGS